MSKFTYLMGLISADGYLIKYKERPLYVEIESTEQDLLTKISNEYGIKLHYRERIIKNKIRYFWRINLKNIIPHEYLSMFNKYRSNLFDYFKYLTPYDKNDFILGLWDGDGSIIKRANGLISANIVINSETESIINIVEDYLKSNDIEYSKYFDKRGIGCYNYQIIAKYRRKFFNLLYLNKDIFSIERKKLMAFEYLLSDK